MDPLQNLWNTLQQILQTLNTINQTMTTMNATLNTVFPQSQGISTSATSGTADPLPGAPASYLTITLPNGQTGKIAIWNP